LNQPLSPFALAAIELFGPGITELPASMCCPSSSLLWMIPRQVLAAQQFKARGEAGEPAQGGRASSTTKRMALLEERSPTRKPLEELLGAAYALYRRGHPWVSEPSVPRAKSVLRDMYERGR